MSGSPNMQALEAERGRRENPEKGWTFIRVTLWPNRAERRRLARQEKKEGDA